MLSQTGEYALRATVHLAREEREGQRLQAEEIADALKVPRNYLSKILHALGRSGLLESTRGPGGGFRLAQDRRCIMGQEVCSDSEPCAAHERWKSISRAVQAFFHGTTIAALAEGPDPGLPEAARLPR
jgi:DNA-binding IscR family transcriptional regulator